MLFEIGAGAQVEAVDDQSDYPDEVPTTDLSGFEPNIEAIVSYEPDLVVLAGDAGGVVEGARGARRAGAPAAGGGLDRRHVRADRASSATRRGTPEEADLVVDAMRADVDEILASAPDGEGVSVYHELDDTYYSVTSDTFIGQVYSMFGVENIADEAKGAGSGYPQLSSEYIVDSDPSLIVLADGECCGQDALDGRRAARMGRSRPPSRPARWSRSTTTSPRAGDRGSSTSCARSPTGLRGVRRVTSLSAGSRRGRRVIVIGMAIACVIAAVIGALLVGPVRLAASGVLAELFGWVPFVDGAGLDDQQATILWQLRAPRVVLACLVGACLAVSGAAYQGAFRNPLADPYLLGAAAGAGLGATIALVSGSGGSFAAGTPLLPIASFVGALVGVAVAYAVGGSMGGRTTTGFVLAGVAVASFFTAVQTFVQQQNSETLREVYTWILGRLATAGWSDVDVDPAVRGRQHRGAPAARSAPRRAGPR